MGKHTTKPHTEVITFEDIAELSDSEAGEPHLIGALVEAELQKHGSLQTAPCDEAREIIRAWCHGDQETERDFVQQWRGHVARLGRTPLIAVEGNGQLADAAAPTDDDDAPADVDSGKVDVDPPADTFEEAFVDGNTERPASYAQKLVTGFVRRRFELA